MIPYQGKNRRTVNYLRTVYLDRPQWTPCSVNFLPATWIRHGTALEELVVSHPRVFPNHVRGSVDFTFPKMWNPLYEPGRHTDCWGVVWENIARGLDSQVAVTPDPDGNWSVPPLPIYQDWLVVLERTRP